MATTLLPGLAEAYDDNPYEVAGFAHVPTPDPADIDKLMGTIKSWARSDGARLLRPHAAQLLFGLLHVARTSYATCGKPEYWPHVDVAVRGELQSSERRRVREMFRDALNLFGYPSVGGNDGMVRDVTYHCGVPDHSLPGLVEYAADVVDAEGEAAIDLRAGDLAALVPESFPGLHIGVRKLLQSGQRGVEPLWAAVAAAVFALRQGETPDEAAGSAHLPCGVSGVVLREALQKLQSDGRKRPVPTNATTRPPRLRYEFDTGSVRVWLPKGGPGDWAIAGADLSPWDVTATARTACLLRPPTGPVTATGPGRPRTWHLRRAGLDGVLFHAGSGHLLDADELAGLDPGPCVLAWPGPASPQVGAESLRLDEWSYLMSPGWSAWRVEVPEWHRDRTYWEVGGARLPLARRPQPAVWLPEPQAWADDERTGERLRVYAAPPRLTAGRGGFEAVFVHRRSAGLTPTRGRVSAHLLGSQADKPAAGLYSVRKKQGVGVTVARYAVLTDLAVGAPVYDGADGVSLLVRGKPFCGRWTGANVKELPNPIGWQFRGRTDRPALEAAYTFEGLAEGTLHFTWPVAGLRWRVLIGGVAGEWGRRAVRVSPAAARHRDSVLQVQADGDVLVNGQPVKGGCYRNRDGGVLVEVRLEGYAHAETLTVTANGQTLRAAVVHDRPTLTKLSLARSDFGVTVSWSSPSPDEVNKVLAWNPYDPASPLKTFDVRPDTLCVLLRWADFVPAGGTWPAVCVAMARVKKSGFSSTRQLAVRDDDLTQVITAAMPRKSDIWAANPVLLAVAAHVTTRMHAPHPPDAAAALAVAQAAGSPRSLPAAEWREFLGRLPATWAAVRDCLAAWGKPPLAPAELLAVNEYAAWLDELSGGWPRAKDSDRLAELGGCVQAFNTSARLPSLDELIPFAKGHGDLPVPTKRTRWVVLWTVPPGRNPRLGLAAIPLQMEARRPDPAGDRLQLIWQREEFAWSVKLPGASYPYRLDFGGLRVSRPEPVQLCERWGWVERIEGYWGNSPVPALSPGVAVVEAALLGRPGPRAVMMYLAERAKARPMDLTFAGQALAITPRPDLSAAAHAAWRLAFAARAGRRLGDAPDLTDALVAAGPVERVAGLLALAEMLCVALFTDGLGFAARWTPVVAHPSPPVATVSRR